MQDLINGRCGWCGTDELYVKYHDQEWGKLVTDDKKLFEFLVLESAQAGLSWITILRKREGYRKAFCDFDAEQVARMTDEDVRQTGGRLHAAECRLPPFGSAKGFATVIRSG